MSLSASQLHNTTKLQAKRISGGCEVCKSTHSGTWRELRPAERLEFAQALAERGLHLTLQREAVYEAVLGCPGHICAEHVVAVTAERHPGLHMDKTTAYRTLDLLAELGLVSEHKCCDGRAQYEPSSRGPNSHLLCKRCGSLSDLDETVAARFRDALAQRIGFHADLGGYPIVGVCAACQVS